VTEAVEDAEIATDAGWLDARDATNRHLRVLSGNDTRHVAVLALSTVEC
jgi:hypothetical protein